jgi:iron(III) transport system substrate-binding protein
MKIRSVLSELKKPSTPYVLFSVLWSCFTAPAVFGQTKADWKTKWDGVVAEAKKEGTIVVFGPGGTTVRKIVTERFSKAFPDIRIEFSGARGNDLAAKVRAERDAGIYSVDVVVQGTTTANLYFKPLGLLPIEPILMLPEITNLSNWRNNALDFSDKEKLNLVFGFMVKTPLVYNIDHVRPSDVDELNKLLDPKWKGKMLLGDPIPSGSGSAAFRWLWAILGPEKAKAYFKNIRAQAGAVDRDERRMIEWVAQGRYAIHLGAGEVMVPELQERGLKFGIVTEFKGAGGLITAGASSIMRVTKPAHPNAQIVFINWLLSKEGQTAWSEATKFNSRRTDVPTAHLPSFAIPKPGVKYWNSYVEENVDRTAEEEALLKALFGR